MSMSKVASFTGYLCVAGISSASVLGGLLVAASTTVGRHWLHEFDRHVLHERLMDGIARVKSDEDWATAEPLLQPQDYGWLGGGSQPVRIAHALGEAGSPSANTIAAMQRAHRLGLRHFEVDLSMDGQVLRCHHGPEAPPPLQTDSCRFDLLLEALPEDSWLVLDIKTDFSQAGERVLKLLEATPKARQVIFQLYTPEQTKLFNRWQREAPLAGPLVTAYLAHRRLDHVAENAKRIGVRVLSLPTHRLVALTRRDAGLMLFLHPIHNCESLRSARAADASGVYMLSHLICPATDRAG